MLGKLMLPLYLIDKYQISKRKLLCIKTQITLFIIFTNTRNSDLICCLRI